MIRVTAPVNDTVADVFNTDDNSVRARSIAAARYRCSASALLLPALDPSLDTSLNTEGATLICAGMTGVVFVVFVDDLFFLVLIGVLLSLLSLPWGDVAVATDLAARRDFDAVAR